MRKSERQIARAATQVVALFVLSKALGLAREMVIGASFGTQAAYDAYLAAATIPDILFTLIAGGALGSAFIPTFAGYFARDDSQGGWRLASGVINLLLVTLTAMGVLAWLTAPFIVRTVLVPGFAPAQQDLTISLMRVMLVAPLFFGISGVVMGALNARQHFILPALAPSLLNLSIIGAATLLAPRMGVHALALGYVLGAVLHLLVQIPALPLVGARYTPLLTLRDPGIREVLRLMAPRVLGLAAVQLNFLVNKNVASWLGEGAVSALNYGWLLMLLPEGILAQAVATAAFPTFAEQVAQGEGEALRRPLTTTLRAVFVLTIPAAMGLLVLGRPLVALLFQRGAFGAASTDAVTWALTWYAVGLLGHAGIEIVARAFYALHDTWTPVWIGGVAMGLNIILSLTLPPLFGYLGYPPHGGLALANSTATLIEMVWLLARIGPRVGGLEVGPLVRTTVRSGLAAGAMAIALILWRTTLSGHSPALVGGGGILIGGTIYLAATALLQREELSRVAQMLVRR